MTETLRDRIRAGALTVGTFVNLGSALAAEACALAGFDWLVVDLEHGGGSEQALAGQLLAAAAHGVPVVVRAESTERIRAGRILDLGADGVMFPRVDTAAAAAAAVGHLRYPPDGDRGVATYNRAYGFGLHGDLVATAGERVVGVVQIESRQAVVEVAAIAATSGVDVLFVGPRDLSHALGVPGDTEAPAYREALAQVAAAAAAHGVAAGILVPDVAAAERHLAAGFRFVAIGSDSAFVVAGARAAATAPALRR